MIVKRHLCDAFSMHLAGSGENIRIPEQCLESLFYANKQKLPLPVAVTPPRRQNLARMAFLGSERVKEGFAFHNTLYTLKPATWKAVLHHARPQYVLVESCLYDSEKAWPQLALQKDHHAHVMARLTETARKNAVPSIFWHTMGSEYLAYFSDIMRYFDIVACADVKSLEHLKRQGLHARLLPYAFSPECCNPLSHFILETPPARLLFDGTARMLRFAPVRDALQNLLDCDLLVVDTSMITTEYTLQRFAHKALAGRAWGCLGRENAAPLYLRPQPVFHWMRTPKHLIRPHVGGRWRLRPAAPLCCTWGQRKKEMPWNLW